MPHFQLTAPQLQRDLEWIAFSPVILDIHNLPDGYWLTHQLSNKIKLQINNSDLTKIIERLASRKSYLLGIYYEVLWHYLLAEKLNYLVLATNLQIKSDKGTLGEFDLIYQASTQKKLYHRELAVKYYLGLPCDPQQSYSPWSNWMGPGLKDRLDLKINKLINKQGLLSQTTEGQTVLKQQHLFPVTPEILLQGYLFYPFELYCPPPEYAKPDHLFGYWLTTDQLESFIDAFTLSSQFTVLDKHEWLSTFSSDINKIQPRLLTQTALKAHANQHFEYSPYPFPLLIANGLPCKQNWQENLRFFLVPNNWLANATEKISYYNS